MASISRPQRNRNLAARAVPLQAKRFWIICLFFFFWACLIAMRLCWLQILRHGEYVSQAQKQQQRSTDVNPRRGVLYDRNLHELAMTLQVDSLEATPGDIADKHSAAAAISALVHLDANDDQTTPEAIEAKLNSGHNYIWVAHNLPGNVVERIREALKSHTLSGVSIQKEFQRFYPQESMASPVLGYIGADNKGLAGLELKFEDLLHGVPGHMVEALDAHRHSLGSQLDSDPEPGRNLVLTLDSNIQFRAERALDEAMTRTQSASGTVVVQDIHTGQILALAMRPSFNPNQARKITPEELRDHAVSDVYEPGSTFKLLTYASALEEHVATPDDKIDCQGGSMTLAGRVIHDDKGEHFGVITVHEALEHSSDVAAIKLALKIGPDRFYQYIRNFGFGQRSGIELPGETRGLLQPVKRWNPSSIGSIAMGQEVAVTPIQLVTMVSTIANGGVYLPPHILMPGQTGDQPGQLAAHPFKPGGDIPNPLPEGAHRVISTMAAAQMRQMMEGVVNFGTGRQAQLNGYSSGGKTGTAQKIDPATHRYSQSLHVATFAGIAPINNPVIAVAVVMDNPKGDYHGASVSAPVFKDVAQQVLEYLGVPHDKPVHAVRPQPQAPVEEDVSDHTGEISALYAAANDLPDDDPQRGGNALTQNASPQQPQPPAQHGAPASSPLPARPTAPVEHSTTIARIPNGKQVRVPALVGLTMRRAIEQAALAGLQLQVVGSGNVRQQMPAAGSSVAEGTRIIVQCGR